MKHVHAFALVAALLAVHASAQSNDVASTESAVAGLRSTKLRGVVSVMAQPALSDGRLILKVVAFNSTGAPASFGDGNVKLFTAAGKPVGVIPLERLIADVEAAAGVKPSERTAVADHQQANYSGPSVSRNMSGQPDVSMHTGTNRSTSGAISPHTRASAGNPQPASSDPELQKQIEGLKAGILQALVIAPQTAAGGQVVSEKLKFARKEARTLRAVVEFIGEQHEFNFTAPEDN